MALVKTFQATDLIALQQIAANATLVGTPVDVSLLYAVMFYIDWAAIAATVITDGTELRIEAAGRLPIGGALNPDNTIWTPILSIVTGAATAATTNTPNPTNPGTTVITQGATGNYSAGGFIFILNSTILNSEFCRVITVTPATSITVQDPTSYQQNTQAIWNKAERYAIRMDLDTIKWIRGVVFNNRVATNRTVAARITMTSLDSI
jgi:hypothetical protein